LGPRIPALYAEAVKAATQWVLEPVEEHRRAAQASGNALGASAPAGLLAMAVGWTGGSLAPPMSVSNPKVPKPPPVPPGPFLPAKAVAGALLLLTAKGEPAQATRTQRVFAELGLGVAEGRFPWPEVEIKTPEIERTWKRRISKV
jgi:hypothetical protein